MALIALKFLSVVVLSLPACNALLSAKQYCKPLPGDADWPSDSAWQALNASVSGRLVAPVPPGAVCHPDWPQYNNASCRGVLKDWTITNFHTHDLVSVDYNDETCLPSADAPCSSKGYPSYVIDATNVRDIQEGVKFAKRTGVRLVVKGTGHDFPGRSSGAQSLSIYTHHLRGIETVKKLKSNSPTEPAALVKIHAGERFFNVYDFAATNNLTIIGGSDHDVGAGGWHLGGGHGPVTAKFGMGADQVVEFEVVNANGEYMVINEHCEPDLFWAMRGSGGSTYAVLVSVTVKAYPNIAVTRYTFSYNTTKDSETFWSMVAYFHTRLPQLSQAGLMGYYYVVPVIPGESKSMLSGTWIGPGLSAAELKQIVYPMENTIAHAAPGDKIHLAGSAIDHPSFSKLWSKFPPDTAGFSGRMGSRLLDQEALSSDVDTLKAALRKATASPWALLGNLIAGPGTHHPPDGIPGGSNAVGSGWRKAYTHIMLLREWTPLNTTAMIQMTTQLRDVDVEALRQLAPDTGAYVNEVDPTEPNWQKTLYGDNWERLSKAKAKYDPSGVFWCKNCVGSELWERQGPYGIENGVGQNLVRLCLK